MPLNRLVRSQPNTPTSEMGGLCAGADDLC
jgi:hypothetical protein